MTLSHRFSGIINTSQVSTIPLSIRWTKTQRPYEVHAEGDCCICWALMNLHQLRTTTFSSSFNVLLIGRDADVLPPVVNRSDITQVCIINYSMCSKERKWSIASCCHVVHFTKGLKKIHVKGKVIVQMQIICCNLS